MIAAAALTASALALTNPAAFPAAGSPFATISIPAIGLHALVREGVARRVLELGPGHYPGSGLPGRGRTVAIAGHRVTHTRPFLRLNELERGQRIVLTRRSRRFVYRVSAMRVLAPTDVWPLRMHPPVERLVLTACHPPHSARHRLVVFAKRVSAPPGPDADASSVRGRAG
jgi:sortase A